MHLNSVFFFLFSLNDLGAGLESNEGLEAKAAPKLTKMSSGFKNKGQKIPPNN